jgi:hypothetical protein
MGGTGHRRRGVQQPGIHGEEAAGWPDDDPTGPIEGLPQIFEALDEPTAELPRVDLPIPKPTGARPAGGSGPKRFAIAPVVAVLLLVSVLIVRSGQSPPAQRAAGRPDTSGGSWGTPAGRPAEATFEVADGAATIRFHTADLGPDLYRVDAPGARPQVTEEDGTVRLSVADRTGPVEIALAADVRWDLRIGGGGDLSTIDLSGARPRSVELTGGASEIDLTLPRPDGTLTVTLSAGVSLFDVHSAQHVPVRVRVGSGASMVVLDGLSHREVAAGALFTPDLWAAAVDRIDLDAVAGMSAMTVASY